MNIIAVDDEKLALEAVISATSKVVPDVEVHGFRKATDALKYLSHKSCDIAFLDIEMRDMNGMEMAERLVSVNPRINIIFTTGYSEYATDAFEMHASGYIMKPVTPEKIKKELDSLRFPIDQEEKLISVQAFGNFEVFYKQRPIHFQYQKTKELLAYLVDRNGALTSNREIISILWEDDDDDGIDSHLSYFKNLRSDLFTTLESIGCSSVIVKGRGVLGIMPSAIKCDYYDYLDDPHGNKALFRGEYMSQYSWGEYTLGSLI